MKFLITLITLVIFSFSSSAMAGGVVKSEKIFPGGKFDASKMMVNGIGGIGEFGEGEANGTPDNNNIQGASIQTDLTNTVSSTYNLKSHVTAVGGAPLSFARKDGSTSDCQVSPAGVITLGLEAGTCEVEVVAAKVYPGCTANTCNPKVYPTTEAKKLITFNVSVCADGQAAVCIEQKRARDQAIFDTAEKARVAAEAEAARVATAAAAEAKRVAAEEEAKQRVIAEAKHAAEAAAEAERARLAAAAAAAEAAERTRLEALAAAEAAKKVRLAAEALAAEQAQARAAAAAAAAEADRLAKAAIQTAKDLLAKEQAKVIALPAKGIAYKTKKTRAFRDLMSKVSQEGTWTLLPAATPFDWAAPNGLYGPVLNSGQGDEVHAFFAGYILWPGIKGQSTAVQFADICDDGFMMDIATAPGIAPANPTFTRLNNYIDQGPGFWWGAFNGGPFSVTRVAGEAYYFEINYFEAYGHATCSLFWNAGNGQRLTYANKQVVPGASLACSANAWPGVKTYAGTNEARCQ